MASERDTKSECCVECSESCLGWSLGYITVRNNPSAYSVANILVCNIKMNVK